MNPSTQVGLVDLKCGPLLFEGGSSEPPLGTSLNTPLLVSSWYHRLQHFSELITEKFVMCIIIVLAVLGA